MCDFIDEKQSLVQAKLINVDRSQNSGCAWLETWGEVQGTLGTGLEVFYIFI